LTLSFLAEAVEEIEDEGLREEITTRLAGWLERRRS
jgi:Fe-S cluster assembly protein SufD